MSDITKLANPVRQLRLFEISSQKAATSTLKSSDLKCFQPVFGDQSGSLGLAVTTPGGDGCKLPLKVTEEEKEAVTEFWRHATPVSPPYL